jgi:hypothetical protein
MKEPVSVGAGGSVPRGRHYILVFIIHHPFTFTCNIFVQLVFNFCKKLSYINVCKVPEYFYYNPALHTSAMQCTIYYLRLPISSWHTN